LTGIVLEGGGARGAYHIGACKAIFELGIEIQGIAGTSIGAINGAMVAQNDLDKAYDIWYDISPAKIFDIDEYYLNRLKKFIIDEENLNYFLMKLKKVIKNKGIDTRLIKKALDSAIDEQRLRKTNMHFGMVTVSLSDFKPLKIFLEDIPEGKVVDYLMASAQLPIFRFRKIDGKIFLDGGFYDNCPIDMLITKNFKNIIAVRTYAPGKIRKVKAKGVNIKYINPSGDLGNILDFSTERVRNNLEMGYYDTMNIIKSEEWKLI
jgi:NTE family protein